MEQIYSTLSAMTSKEYTVQPMRFPEDGNKVILEYTMVNYTRLDLITKTYVVDFEPKSVEECPIKHTHEFDSDKAEYPAPEITMKPVAMCRDPFRLGKHKIVLCEPLYADQRNKDIAFNTRKKCKEILEKVKEQEPWFGIEQEFYITDKNDIPLDWSIHELSIDINSEMTVGDHVGFERHFVDLHLRACIYAGLEMYGSVREILPSEWEFQVGPLPGIQTADQLILARYILVRLAEIHNVKISFRNIDCARDTNARQALHLNFSTKKTRAEDGIKSIYEIIANISKYPQEALFRHYDLSHGEEMKWYLDSGFYVASYHKFKHTIGEKHKSSIRIPRHVANEGKGYIEERRPVSSADPYDVCRVFTYAALFDHNGEPLL
ncbi:glutamine synthetase-like [Mercenaria mercenaria]|uniref:glutamine synthetase-like n=1 Tax=Mercenaria mercenaria TaxID=6596 RepID=UPI00234EFAF2|nr:glutamine synthetase-like [Mercenaria mercenaria]